MNTPPIDPSKQNRYYGPFQATSDMKKNFFCGGALAAGVAFAGAPLDYLKNMRMSNQNASFRDCFRGVALAAVNDVPAASIAQTINFLARRWFQQRNEGGVPTMGQQLMTSAFAGGVSGMCISPGQMVVLNYQLKKSFNGKQLSLQEIFYEAGRAGGIRRLFIGCEMTMLREMNYAMAYLVLADRVARFTRRFFVSEEGSVAGAAILTGALAGGVTTPFEYLRIQKQALSLSEKNVSSYLQILGNLKSYKMLFSGVIPRTIGISFAVFCLVEGRRHLFPHLID